MEYVIAIAVVAVIWVTLAKQAANRKVEEQASALHQRATDMASAACQFITRANAARCFPEVSPGDVNIKAGEFALLREHATLFEQKTNRVGSAVGTRVNIGRMPLYLGSTASSTYETTRAVAEGELVLTNSRLIFMSAERSAALLLKDVVGMNASLDAITLHSAKRKNPYVFAVTNPVLWSLLAKIGTSHPLESRFIPDGVTLTAKPSETLGEVNFEATLGHARLGAAA